MFLAQNGHVVYIRLVVIIPDSFFDATKVIHMPMPVFELEQLFGSQTRARLLALFLLHPTTAFFVRELTRRIDAQLNSVRRELKNLLDLELVIEKEGSGKTVEKKSVFSQKKKFYIANSKSILFEDLRSLFRKIQILLKQSLVKEIEHQGTLDYLAFTGRFVDSKNTQNPIQTDLFIVGSIDQKVLQKLIGGLEIDIGHEINYTLLPKEEFLYRKQVSDRFLSSILGSEKVVMVNRLGI